MHPWHSHRIDAYRCSFTDYHGFQIEPVKDDRVRSYNGIVTQYREILYPGKQRVCYGAYRDYIFSNSRPEKLEKYRFQEHREKDLESDLSKFTNNRLMLPERKLPMLHGVYPFSQREK